MSSFATAGFVVFILLLFVGIYLSLFGLPGTIIIFLDVLLYALFTGFAQVNWKVLLFLLIFALLSEAIDFWAGSTDAHKPPVNGQSIWGALLGAVTGMLILTPALWGLGVWAGFFLGGLAGLLLMEWFRQSRLKIPHQATYGALLAMTGIKAVKGGFALIMIFVSLSNIYS